ncbi:MAG: class I tRNA ligase family protein, partial [Candidatus Aenigmarchaeota archaeon]|nr:class I tRNA ligase family protein [Candidatus Aenigmarchaeota archaeon]
TTIADCEIEYKDLPTFFNDIKFMVKETGEEIVIGTTRPELVCSCGMVIFNPEDKRYKHLDGKTAVTPVFGKEVPIKAHPYADMDKGTGLVMMCSAGDTTDIRFFREMGIEPVISIDKDGTMNENAGFLKGLKIRDARLKMVEKLKEEGLHVSAKRTTHRTPVCERSKDEVEFIEMSELYLKQVDFKKDMIKIAKKLDFYSESSRRILLDWIDGVSIDWPISRRRYYATPIPLWYCRKCGEVIVPEKGRLYSPWNEKCPVSKCPKCGCGDFDGDERVFDTWFDSSNSPLYILKYSKDDAFFGKSMPCSLRPQGKEIVRTWLYYTLLKGYLLLDKPIFDDVCVHFHILDDKGIKMSKSLGNVLDPREVLDKFGAEPFRLWAAVEGNLDRTDFRCSFDRIDGAGKTLAKLWNVARFISMFDAGTGKAELNDFDRWIRSEMARLVKLADKEYAKYNFHKPMVVIKHFIWETFSSHYLELVKNRAYNSEGKFSSAEQSGAVSTLNYCLETMLKVVSPVVPFLTYKVYMELKG